MINTLEGKFGESKQREESVEMIGKDHEEEKIEEEALEAKKRKKITMKKP